MPTISCAVCGVAVEGARARQKYCSRKCTERGKPSAKWQGGVHGVVTHGSASMYKYGCRCDLCREAQRVKIAAYAAKVKAEHGVVPSALYKRRKPRRACGWCGEVHEHGSRGIGGTHAQWRRHYTPSESREMVQYQEPQGLARFKPERPPSRIFVSGDCSWCGERFMAVSNTGLASTCSARCRKRLSSHRRRARGGRFSITAARRARLMQRDGHTCQICFLPTSEAWSADDPWSPTLDHIEPQASAPDPDHSDENLRLVHAICNSYRRDGAVSDAEVRGLVLKREATRVSS